MIIMNMIMIAIDIIVATLQIFVGFFHEYLRGFL